MRARSRRPEVRLEIAGLGVVNPFELRMAEEPPGSGQHVLLAPGPMPPRTSLDLGGLALVGAGQALFALAMRWLTEAGREVDPFAAPAGEVRLMLKRRETRLLAALLERHLDRLPEPPRWMPELLEALVQVDEFFRWEAL